MLLVKERKIEMVIIFQQFRCHIATPNKHPECQQISYSTVASSVSTFQENETIDNKPCNSRLKMLWIRDVKQYSGIL